MWGAVAGQPALSFAGLLRRLREQARLTQEELAEAAGLSPRSVSDLERGIHPTARKDTALLLADALSLAGPARELFVTVARGRTPAAEVLAAAREMAPGAFAAGTARGLPRDAGSLTTSQACLAWLLGTVTGSPYRGLSAFEEQDAAFFFGREMAAAQVLERMSRRLEGAGLLVVSGVSGAGKSSLLRAGVLPRIRETGLASAPGSRSWPCLLFTPTRSPLDELALHVAVLAGADASAVRRGLAADPAGFALTARQAALAEPYRPAAPAAERDQPTQPRLLLVVDQFEELFTQCADEGQRRAFITVLHAAASARHGPHQPPAALVVLGVRADFEARCADYPQLTDAVQDRYLVTSMTERQLRLAISEPAKKAGSKVDDDLVGVLLAEMRNGQPGAFGAGVLPLLSHALDQAWRCRAGETVALGDYERTGGIEGAVADSAQRTYDRLTPAQQAAARHVFTQLTTISSEGVDSADRATRAELTEGKSAAEAQDVETVLEAFAAQRLLTLAAGTVEISHEALLTAWPLLHDTWLAETHADRIVRTQLHNTAAEWARHARDPSYLYSGSLLQAAAGAADRIGADPARHPPLGQTERDFLHASHYARRRRARQRQGFLAFLLALIVGLASATVLAVRASQQAAHQRDVVALGQLISESENLGETDPAISALLSIAAWRIAPSSAARYAMLAAAARPAIAVFSGHNDTVLSVAFSPDGKIMASGSGDGAVRLSNLATHQQIGSPLTGHGGPVNSVAFSPDGKSLASGGDDDTVRLWDLATHRQIGRPFTGRGGSVVNTVAFSPDGTTLASGSLDGTVRLWDVATHQQVGRLPAGGVAILSVAFSPDGKTLASGSGDGTVRLWEMASHRQIGSPLTGHGGPVNSVAFSPDGKSLASGGADGTVRLWDLATHRQIGGPLTGHDGPVFSVAFTPDGKSLASGGADKTVRLWDLATHRQIGSPLTGHGGLVNSVAFSPDGKALASGSDDHTVRLWDLATGRQIGRPLTGHRASVSSVTFSPDGTTLATGSVDFTARLWDLATGRQVGSPLNGHSSVVESVAFSPDGKTLATGGEDGTARLWDLATHRQIGSPLTGHSGAVVGVPLVAFSHDGKTLATGGDGNDIAWLWDLATHRQIGSSLTGNGSVVSPLAFSPDAKTLATGNIDGTARLWDLATHRQIGSPLTGHGSEATSIAFSPGGKTLATGDDDGRVRLWDLATHRQIGSPLTGHSGVVYAVAFSPDGKTLASGSADGTVRLWDLATHRQIGSPLTGHNGPVWSVAFSPDGKTLATGGDDKTIRTWNVTYVAHIVPDRYLCASAGRSLTRAEWARYVPPGLAYQKLCP
jgi:WD40 repeat protein/transcriptional regulator with XRE-family HTH domain